MPEFFDKVLVDAPCSGEGMFRKDMDVAKTWDESRPEFFANLQREIVSNADFHAKTRWTHAVFHLHLCANRK